MSRIWTILGALAVFLLLWPPPPLAMAQPVIAAEHARLSDIVVAGQVAITVVVAILEMLRRGPLRRYLAPRQATERSKLLNHLVAVGLGVAMALTGVAPALTPSLAGQVFAGLGIAALSILQRDIVVRTIRSGKRSNANGTPSEE